MTFVSQSTVETSVGSGKCGLLIFRESRRIEVIQYRRSPGPSSAMIHDGGGHLFSFGGPVERRRFEIFRRPVQNGCGSGSGRSLFGLVWNVEWI